MIRKASFAVSVGALLITSFIVVAGIFIYNNSASFTGKAIGESASSGMSHQHTIKREEIKQALTSSFIQALKEIEFNGGYAKGYHDEYYPSKSMDYAMNYVALYRVCGENHYPTLEEIKQHLINRTLYYFYKKMLTYENQDHDFGFYGVNGLTLNILDDKVQIVANVNIEYKGMSVPSEYFIEVPTRLKKIYEFATNFTEMMAKLRLTDFYMINLLYSANDYYLPTGGILTKCGDSISLSAAELTDHFYALYSYLLANIDFFKPLDLDVDDPPHYNLILVGAIENLLKDYNGLSILLRKPDDFIFKFSQGVYVSNDKWLSYNPFAPVPECIKRYDFSYSFPFAYIVSIKDDLVGGDVFYNFAEFSMIENMVPKEDCGYDDYFDNKFVYAPTVMDMIVDSSSTYTSDRLSSHEKCVKGNIDVVVRVRDKSNGDFIENANVYYKGCYVGTTDSRGYLKFKVPSNTNDNLLIVEKEGYITYISNSDPSQSPLTILLYPVKPRDIRVRFIVAHTHLEPKPYIDYVDEDFHNPNYGYSIDVSSHISHYASDDALLWLDYCEVKDDLDINYEGIITFSQDDLMVYDPQEIKEDNNLNDNVVDYLTRDSVAFIDSIYINSSNRSYYNVALPPLNLYVHTQLYSPLSHILEGNTISTDSNVDFLSDVQFVMLSNDASKLTLYIPIIKVDEVRTANEYVSRGYLNFYKTAIGKYGLNNFINHYDFYKKDIVNLITNGCGMKLSGIQIYNRTYSLNLGLPNSLICKRLKTIAFSCDQDTYNSLKYVDDCSLDDDCCNVDEVVDSMRQHGCNIISVNHRIGW